MIVTACGIAVTDIISAGLPQIAGPGEVIFGLKGHEIHIGGHACNVPLDLVQMGLEGKDVSAIISVGNDSLGDFIINGLEKAGVITHAIRSRKSTSSNIILVVKGEDRRFHVDVGANVNLNPRIVKEILEKESPKIFYLGAPGMLGPFDDHIPSICKRSKNLNSITFASIIKPYKKKWSFILPALKYLDIFHGNDFEAFQVTGIKDPLEAAKSLVNKGVKVALVTMGDKGLCAQIIDWTLNMPAFRIAAVDPSGSGDAFCAGIIYKLASEPYRSLLNEKPQITDLTIDHWKEILLYASACGAACCTASGTTTAVKQSIIQRILHEQAETFHKKISILRK